MKRRLLIALHVLVSLALLATNISFAGLNQIISISSKGIILQSDQSIIEMGLRTDCFWDQYIRNPTEFINLANGKVTAIYVDFPWVKEIFLNFDPDNLDKPFLKGNWGYGYTFRDYIQFFRALHQNGIKIVMAISGIGSSSKTDLNFFLEYPNASVDSKWVNPDYVDPTWNGKTFLQMYAEKIHNFTSFIGIPAIVSVEDWRYPGYMMQHPQLTQFKDALKGLNQTNQVWMPPASFGSARVADYNAYKGDHPWIWEFSSDSMMVGGSDIVLQSVWDAYQVYHSSINVVGWIGAQMSAMPFHSGIIVKLYFGGQDLNWNNPPYNVTQMKRKLEDIVVASLLTRILTPNGEYCPVKGFILVYKPPPTATLDDMLEILQYAKDMAYLKTVKVLGPILKIPRNLGYTTYPDRTSPMGGYMIGKGLIPFRFVYEDYVQYVDPSEKVVTHSGKDYSSEFGITFNTTSQCTWLGLFQVQGQDYYVVFHDGGYESGIYNADGTYQPADKISYKQGVIVNLNNLSLNIPADSVTIFDANGNPAVS